MPGFIHPHGGLTTWRRPKKKETAARYGGVFLCVFWLPGGLGSARFRQVRQVAGNLVGMSL
jgi:hypothetical protein